MKTKKLALAALNSLLANMGPEELKFIPATEANAKEAITTLEADISKPGEPYAYEFQKLASDSFGAGWEMHIEKAVPTYCQTQNVRPLYTTPQKPAAAEWMPIETAPKDGTPIDIWRSSNGGERCAEMRRVDLGSGNVFYEPIHSGYSCVRDATHWMQLPAAPGCAA